MRTVCFGTYYQIKEVHPSCSELSDYTTTKNFQNLANAQAYYDSMKPEMDKGNIRLSKPMLRHLNVKFED